MSPMKTLALLGGAMVATATPALAGSYGGCGPTAFDCAPDVWVSSTEAVRDEVLVSIDQPYGHLRSVDYRRSPAVSITRLHDQGNMPGLSDHPSGFAGGCDPVSTQYCREGGHAPAAPAPMIAAPYQPIVAPVVAAPVQAPLRQWTASYNDDPARFAPRQYGSLDFVPGIAHVPSSWVDRDPGRAQAALNASGAGGIAPGPQSGLSRIPDDTPGPLLPIGQLQGPRPVQPGSVVQPGPASHAPALPVAPGSVRFGGSAPMQSLVMQGSVMQAPVMPAPVIHAPVMHGGMGVSPSGVQLPNLAPAYPATPSAPMTADGRVYASQVGADGTYWEKVSGTQLMGSTVVSSVICKRALETEVVNPVVGVPQPYGVPVPVQCEGGVHHSRYAHTQGLAGGH